MKKTAVFFVLVAVLLTGCKSHYNLNLIKANPQQHIVDSEVFKEKLAQHEEENTFSHEEIPVTNTETVSALDTEEFSSVKSDPDTLKIGEDSKDESEEVELMMSEAVRTEKLAKAAMGTGIAAVATLVGGLIGIVGFPLFIASLVLYLIANKSRYNTEKGARKLKVARVFLTIYGIVLAVTLSLVIIAFLIF
jgi:hypothetical protein